MPFNPDDIMDDLDREIQAQVFAESNANRQIRFEETCMNKLLAKFALSAASGRLKSACRTATGQYKLTFEWFEQEYPSFPVRIHFRKMPFTHKINFSDLFKRMTKLPFVEDFMELSDSQDDGRPTALVFSWAAMKDAELREGVGTTVIHNMAGGIDIRGTTINRRILTDPPQTLVVMPYADFLDGLKWRP